MQQQILHVPTIIARPHPPPPPSPTYPPPRWPQSLLPLALQILGNNECFEPYTSNIYVRRVLSGEFTVVNQHLLMDLTRLGLWSPDLKNELVAANGSIQVGLFPSPLPPPPSPPPACLLVRVRIAHLYVPKPQL